MRKEIPKYNCIESKLFLRRTKVVKLNLCLFSDAKRRQVIGKARHVKKVRRRM